jgi:carboxypeptidase family protein
MCFVRPVSAALVIFALVVPISLPAIAQETAMFSGTVTDTSGKAVGAGYTVKLKDVASGSEFNGVTDATGSYKVQVPVGGRYRLESVLADDGKTVLPVQKVPPIAALVASNNRLDVRFTQAPAPPAAAVAAAPAVTPPTTASAAPAVAKAPPAATGTPTAATAPPSTTAASMPPPPPPAKEEEKKKSSAPWYKKPGPIIGMVAGAGGVLAIALSGGDDDGIPAASPSEPGQ